MLYGRDIELELLRRHLNVRLSSASDTRLYVIRGPAGTGKTSLLQDLSTHLRARGRPTLFLNLGQWATQPETQDEAFVLRQISATQLDLPSHLPEEGWGSYWRRVLDETIPEVPQVIVFIDDYHLLGDTRRAFLRDSIIAPLNDFLLSHDARFILATLEDISIPQLSAYWPGHSLQKITLGPLSDTALLDWLHKAQLPQTLLDDLKTQTGAIPARVHTYLRQQQEQREEARALEAEKTLLARIDEAGRHILCIAAVAEEVSVAVLDHFLGDGMKALLWLQNDATRLGIHGSTTDMGFALQPAQRTLILAWFARRQPALYQQTQLRFQGLRAFSQNVGGSRERRILAQLSLLHYFNTDFITEIFAERSGDILKYLSTHQHMFVVEADLWRISPEYIQASQIALELLPAADRHSFEKKAKQAWEKHKEEISAQIQKLESDIVTYKADLARTTTDLETLTPKITQAITEVEMLKRVDQPTAARPHNLLHHWNNVGGLLVAIGVIWIYTGVLAANSHSLGHSAAGALLILIGLWAPQLASRAPAITATIPPIITHSPRFIIADKNRHYLQMRYTSLQHRQRNFSAKISESRSKVTRLDEILAHPFV